MAPTSFVAMMDVVDLVVLARLDNPAVPEPVLVCQTVTGGPVETTVVDINPVGNVR